MSFDLSASRPLHLAITENLPEDTKYVLLAYVPDPETEFQSYAVTNVGVETCTLMITTAALEVMTRTPEIQHFSQDTPA
jgi:hypothetical protein